MKLRTYELFDDIKAKNDIKNDAELARRMGVRQAHISKIRNRVNDIPAEMILRIHEVFGVSILMIRALLAMTATREMSEGA